LCVFTAKRSGAFDKSFTDDLAFLYDQYCYISLNSGIIDCWIVLKTVASHLTPDLKFSLIHYSTWHVTNVLAKQTEKTEIDNISILPYSSGMAAANKPMVNLTKNLSEFIGTLGIDLHKR